MKSYLLLVVSFRIWQTALVTSQTLSFNDVEVSSTTQAIGSDVNVTASFEIKSFPDSAIPLEWIFGSDTVWNVVLRGSSSVTPTCGLSDCSRFPLNVNTDDWPTVRQTLTITDLQEDDNGTIVKLSYFTQESVATLNVTECFVPKSSEGTKISQSENPCRYNCIITYNCDEGYETNNVQKNTSTCIANATLNPPSSSFVCMPVVCQIDLSQEEVNSIGVDVEVVTFGEPEYYPCAIGYPGSGASFNCTSNGTAETNINCSAVICPTDMIEMNETLLNCPSTQSVEFGNPLICACNIGYTGLGKNFTCLSNQTLDATSTDCDLVICPFTIMENSGASKLEDCTMENVSFGNPLNCSCAADYNGSGITFNCSSNGTAEISSIDCYKVVIIIPLTGGEIAAIVLCSCGGIMIIFGVGYAVKKKYLGDKIPTPSPSPVRISPESPETTSPLNMETAVA